jgi:hypothetical protein
MTTPKPLSLWFDNPIPGATFRKFNIRTMFEHAVSGEAEVDTYDKDSVGLWEDEGIGPVVYSVFGVDKNVNYEPIASYATAKKARQLLINLGVSPTPSKP